MAAFSRLDIKRSPFVLHCTMKFPSRLFSTYHRNTFVIADRFLPSFEAGSLEHVQCLPVKPDAENFVIGDTTQLGGYGPTIQYVAESGIRRLEAFTFSQFDRIATKLKRRLQDRTRTLQHAEHPIPHLSTPSIVITGRTIVGKCISTHLSHQRLVRVCFDAMVSLAIRSVDKDI